MGWAETKPDGNGHKDALHFSHPPNRVVSLVPSMTESMFDLGVGESLVGITDYCIHPAAWVEKLPHLGGTKNPRVKEILALKPDLVLANWEENSRSTVEALREAGVGVWVTFPQSVSDSIEVLWTLANLFKSSIAKIKLQTLELTLDWALSAAAARPNFRYFCPIWYSQRGDGLPWWMTFNRDTYSHDLLQILGGQNVFADRERLYPLDADLGLVPADEASGQDKRYPRVSLDEVRSAEPELILLPDEPYPFDETHLQTIQSLLAETPSVRNGSVSLVEGSLITWQGTRLALSLRELPALLDSCLGA